MTKCKQWTIRRTRSGLDILSGSKVVATCRTFANACLIVCAPTMRAALKDAERALLKANRRSDGSQNMNTDAARIITEIIAPALDATAQKQKGAAPKRRPPARASLPV